MVSTTQRLRSVRIGRCADDCVRSRADSLTDPAKGDARKFILNETEHGVFFAQVDRREPVYSG